MYKIVDDFENNNSIEELPNIVKSSISYVMNKSYSLEDSFRISFLKGVSHLLEKLQNQHEEYAKSIIPTFISDKNEVVDYDRLKEYSFHRECAYSIYEVLQYIGEIGGFEIKTVGDIPSLYKLQVPDEFQLKAASINENQQEESQKKSNKKSNSLECKVIKGVRGLAQYLNIGVTLAQTIINTKVLMESGIQYNAGRSWLFNKEKLDKLLSEKSDILKNIHIKRE